MSHTCSCVGNSMRLYCYKKWSGKEDRATLWHMVLEPPNGGPSNECGVIIQSTSGGDDDHVNTGLVG